MDWQIPNENCKYRWEYQWEKGIVYLCKRPGRIPKGTNIGIELPRCDFTDCPIKHSPDRDASKEVDKS